MSLINFRDTAARLQEVAHQKREHHRQCQKECEVTDQALKKYLRSTDELIKARAAYDAAVEGLTPALKIDLGLIEKAPLPVTKSEVVPTAAPTPIPGPVSESTRTSEPAFIASAAHLWVQGKSTTEIGKELGVSRSAVSGVIHRNREQFPLRGANPFGPTKKVEPAVPIAPAPSKPVAQLPSLTPINGLVEAMRPFLRGRKEDQALHEIVSLEIRFDTTALRLRQALGILSAAGEIEWSEKVRGHFTIKVLAAKEVAA